MIAATHIPDGYKRCSRCGGVKPLGELYEDKDKYKRLDLQYQCIDCLENHCIGGWMRCCKCFKIKLFRQFDPPYFHREEGPPKTCHDCTEDHLRERSRIVLPFECGYLCYALACGVFIKIGMTKKGLKGVINRFNSIQSAIPYTVRLMGIHNYEGRTTADSVYPKNTEEDHHRNLAKWKHKGEWFVSTIDVLQYVTREFCDFPIQTLLSTERGFYSYPNSLPVGLSRNDRSDKSDRY